MEGITGPESKQNMRKVCKDYQETVSGSETKASAQTECKFSLSLIELWDKEFKEV